ncbi:MAG: hypothetical protein OXD49_19745 [Candidatus Poribacteria bacterium]|nr:hypothetical protein [Candidatus Poribacteria bacterium]
MEVPPDEQGRINIGPEISEKIEERMKPLEEEYRSKFQDQSNELDRNYQRETQRQEQMGETLSRISPTSSLIYLATSLTQTGKGTRSNYSQAGDRYHDMLHTDVFSKIIDHATARIIRPEDTVIITQPPRVEIATLDETFRESVVDVLLLCFFAVVLTTVAFLKFFRSDI